LTREVLLDPADILRRQGNITMEKTFHSLDDYVINQIFKYEVEEYDKYLTGDIWSFNLVDTEGDSIDSCGGFFGTDWLTNGIADHISNEDKEKIKHIRVYDCTGDEIEQLDHEEVFGNE
jgi:hypothetical protein